MLVEYYLLKISISEFRVLILLDSCQASVKRRLYPSYLTHSKGINEGIMYFPCVKVKATD